MILIQPTGVYGQGKSRYYPDVMAHEVDNAWSYCRRLSTIINPDTGHTYVPPGAVGTFMYAVQKSNHAETVDCWLYPEEYWDEAELARQGRIIGEQGVPAAGGTGPYRWADLRMADAQYLNWLVTSNPAKYRDAWLRCIDGEWLDICRRSSSAVYAGEFVAETYDGPLRAVVLDLYGVDQ